MTEAMIGFAALIAISLVGVPLAFSTLIVGIVGFAYFRGYEAAVYMAGQQVADMITSSSLVVVPIFILMGELIRRCGITDELYEFSQSVVGRFRGGLAMSTVVSSGAFSAVCGSSIATAATMTKVAMPPMRRYGYHDALSSSTVAAGGTLGMLIPPSVPMVIYAIFAQEDIGRLWIAGVLPGMLMMGLFVLAIMIMVRVVPSLLGNVPAENSENSVPARKGSAFRAQGFLVLFLVIIGGIYLGIFTPTEAASVGAFGAFLFALQRGKMRRLVEYREVISSAAGISAAIFAIAGCALIFGQFVNISGLPYDLLALTREWELTGLQLILAISVLCILLGMVFESLGILVLVIPIFLPSLSAHGVDLIWFGVIAIILIEIGLITPPLGINVFTVKAAQRDINILDTFKGIIPFVFAMIVTVGLVIAFPTIALWMPDLMR
ncbi:TRAP transporter large permease [Halomonas mongoliensis]|uniref:TRAP transporter large permease n=1 Tax=Halomonas mongoliensis TaxID=321265 RepID=UPI00403B3573